MSNIFGIVQSIQDILRKDAVTYGDGKPITELTPGKAIDYRNWLNPKSTPHRKKTIHRNHRNAAKTKKGRKTLCLAA